MTKSLFLHIGAPKCGSTYIQRTALKNQKTLRENGINYPHNGLGHPGNAAQIDQMTTRWVEQNLQNFDALLLSHEDLFADAGKANKLRNVSEKLNINIHIICVIRPLSTWLSSDFSQSVRQSKWSEGNNLRSFIRFAVQRENSLKPAEFIQDWQMTFPRAEMHLVPLTKISERFSKLHPGFARMDWDLPKWRRNISRDTLSHQYLRGFQSQKVDMLNRYGILL
ncbi:MAG: hypothetical protein ACWA40_06165 [Planktomarina sp.]